MSDPVEGKVRLRRRSTRRAKTRERICDAALAGFFTRGYVATTIEEIAGAAGVRRSTIYTHFRDKQDILGAIAGRFLDDVIPVIRMLPTPRPSRRQIDRWVADFAAFATRQPEATRLLIHFSLEPNAPPAIREFGRKLMQAYADHLPAFANAVNPADGQAWARATAVLRELNWALCHHIDEDGGGRAPYMLEVGADLLEQLVKGWF